MQYVLKNKYKLRFLFFHLSALISFLAMSSVSDKSHLIYWMGLSVSHIHGSQRINPSDFGSLECSSCTTSTLKKTETLTHITVSG